MNSERIAAGVLRRLPGSVIYAISERVRRRGPSSPLVLA
jgi:hypothetical protein